MKSNQYFVFFVYTVVITAILEEVEIWEFKPAS